MFSVGSGHKDVPRCLVPGPGVIRAEGEWPRVRSRRWLGVWDVG